MEIKKVLIRKHDKIKFIIVPRNSDIEVGDYVKLVKIPNEEQEEKEESEEE